MQKTVRISLTIVEAIDQLVKYGIYQNQSEVIRDACRRLCSRYRLLPRNDLDYPTPYLTLEEIEIRKKFLEMHQELIRLKEECEKLFSEDD